jgi:Ca2+-transporting ATPase
MLTGESTGVLKTVDALPLETPVADQTNIVFKGTYILSGSGKAVVIAIGQNSEVGKINKSIEVIDIDMPLKRELNRLSHAIVIFILILCIVLMFIGLAAGQQFNDLLVILTALFICVVPEGLPFVLTLVLVSGAYRMAQKNVLVKKMQAVEALGRTDIIAIDKTGTLTRNELLVSKVYADDKIFDVSGIGYYKDGIVSYQEGQVNDLTTFPMLATLGIASILLNRAEISYQANLNLFDIKGDPTEASMAIFASKLGISIKNFEASYKKIYEIPFDSHWQYHAAFYEHNNEVVGFFAGAPEIIFAHCNDVPERTDKIFTQLLDSGLRVVAIATKVIDPTEFRKKDSDIDKRAYFENELAQGATLAGLLGIQDSIRPEVKNMIEQVRANGLKVIMVTGDHQKTALFVAKHVGILREGDEAIDSTELTQMSAEELVRRLDKTTVYSRISPTNKIMIIKSLQKMGNIVAMTGDGINDAPSLVAADIGIAMGHIGTDVTKQAADVILLDDSFSSIVSAIEQGRHIFYTMQRVIVYFFTTNMAEIFLVLFAIVLNLGLPILPAQILWLNLITDGFLTSALSMEREEKDLLKKTTIGKERLFNAKLIFKIFYLALPMGIVSIFVFYLVSPQNIVLARTLTLVTMFMFQWFNALNCRSATKSIFKLGLFTNRWLVAAMAIVLTLQILMLHIPFLQAIFRTVPLNWMQWLIICLLTSSVLIMEELRKFIQHK